MVSHRLCLYNSEKPTLQNIAKCPVEGCRLVSKICAVQLLCTVYCKTTKVIQDYCQRYVYNIKELQTSPGQAKRAEGSSSSPATPLCRNTPHVLSSPHLPY